MRIVQVIYWGACLLPLITGARGEDFVAQEETDPEWRELVENEIQPELSGILKRGFNNLNLRKLNPNQQLYHHFSFDPIYLQENKNDVTIRNLSSANVITSRLRNLKTDMLHSVFSLDIDLNNIELRGHYELINREQIGILPVTNFGKVKFLLENVTAQGYVGFKRNLNDSLSTTNYNLEYSVDAVKIEVVYLGMNRDQEIKSIKEYKDIDETLLKLFKADLWYKIQTEVIKVNLDYVLADVSVKELFLNKEELISHYSLRSEAMDKMANKVVDQFLRNGNVLIQKRGLSKIPIDDFQRSFQQSWGPLTFWGGFEAERGYVSNLSTIIRTGNFSLVNKAPNEFITFGALGLRDLRFNYDKYKAQIWNVGPSGDIKAVARSNSVAFRLHMNGLNPKRPNFIKEFDFYIEQLDDVDVQITGMGYPMNWLLSRSASWMYGLFRTDVRSKVEQVMESHLQAVVGQSMEEGAASPAGSS